MKAKLSKNEPKASDLAAVFSPDGGVRMVQNGAYPLRRETPEPTGCGLRAIVEGTMK